MQKNLDATANFLETPSNGRANEKKAYEKTAKDSITELQGVVRGYRPIVLTQSHSQNIIALLPHYSRHMGPLYSWYLAKPRFFSYNIWNTKTIHLSSRRERNYKYVSMHIHGKLTSLISRSGRIQRGRKGVCYNAPFYLFLFLTVCT